MATIAAWIRAGVRLAALAVVMLAGAATAPRRRAPLAVRARWLRGVCRRALHALGVTCSAVGTAAAGEILVANHVSYLDILVLAASRPVVFVAKREVRAWPVFGWFARRAGTRFIDRERRGDVSRVAREFAPAIAAGVSVVLFLEGTSTNGRGVQPFKSSLLAPAVAEPWGVVPVAISYRLPAGHEVETKVCWWGGMTLAPHVLQLVQLPRIEARLAWGTPERNARDRKTLAVALHERVTGLHSALRRWRMDHPGSTARRFPHPAGILP